MTTILHISDLHFRAGESESAANDRKLSLDGLLKAAHDLRDDARWRPDIICLTGDVGWSGHRSDYDLAEDWLGKLLGSLELPKESLIICPGNHDLDRKCAKYFAVPSSSEESDKVISGTFEIEDDSHLVKPFFEFSGFCDRFGIGQLDQGGRTGYLWGIREFSSVRFIVLNTAWFSRDRDKGKLWLGLPNIRQLEAKVGLTVLKEPKPLLTVALIHHPRDWLHESETRADDSGRPNTFDYLSSRCDLILSGHTHCEIRPADQFCHAAWHLSSGATYIAPRHPNSFRLIRINTPEIEYKSFQFGPKSLESEWSPHPAEKCLRIDRFQSIEPVFPPSVSEYCTLTDAREASLRYAKRFLARKANAFGSGRAIEPTTRRVELKQPPNTKAPETSKRIPLSMPHIASQYRKVALIGDMGAGKSTQCAQLAITLSKADNGPLAFIVPAKLFTSKLETTQDFIDNLKVFFHREIAPNLPELDLNRVLNERTEVTAIIDGLDELDRPLRAKLLNTAEAASEIWLTLTVIVSGRPAELASLDLSLFTTVVVPDLDESEVVEIVTREEAARGVSDTTNQVDRIRRQLKDSPTLATMLSTPLGVRLLYDVIKVDLGMNETVGDIVARFCETRISDWSIMDDRSQPSTELSTVLPDTISRLRLAAVLAASFQSCSTLSRDAAIDQLEESLSKRTESATRKLANEFLDMLLSTGLVSDEGGIRFPLSTPFEFLLGIRMVDDWLKGNNAVDVDQWRSISYAATFARRLGRFSAVLPALTNAVNNLVQEHRGFPAAAFVVSDAQDRGLAELYVNKVATWGRQPLTIFSDDGRESSRAVASALHCAGDAGIELILTEYLDTRIPSVNYGSRIIEVIFSEWCMQAPEVKDAHLDHLVSYAKAHIGRKTYAGISIVPTIVWFKPNQFYPEDRFRELSRLLSDPFFSERAVQLMRSGHQCSESSMVDSVLLEQVRDENQKGDRSFIDYFLIEQVHKGYEPGFVAAKLWLELNPEGDALTVADAVLGSAHRGIDSEEWASVVTTCEKRMGTENWSRYLRWTLFGQENSAKGAALLIYRAGERRLHVLGRSLLRALHDGGYVPDAEPALREILLADPKNGIRWLARRIEESIGHRHYDGPFSGWWRLFLGLLPVEKEAGPELFRRCLGGLSGWILPRYGEIRNSIRELLTGPDGSEYLRILIDELDDFRLEWRHAAAMILTVIDGGSSAPLALVELVSGAADSFGPMEHAWEWEPLLAATRIEPVALTELRRAIPSLPRRAQCFGLMILWRHGITFSEDELKKLIIGYARSDVSLSRLPGALQELGQIPVFRETLLAELNEGIGERSCRAGALILRHLPLDTLSFRDRLRAICLGVEPYSWKRSWMSELDAAKSEKEYADTVRDLIDEFAIAKKSAPPFALLILAQSDPSMYRNFLLSVFIESRKISSHDDEIWGALLLDLGRRDDSISRALGEAAKAIIDTELINSPQPLQASALQWIAILASEFSDLSDEKIKAVILLDTNQSAPELRIALQARLKSVDPKRENRSRVISPVLPRIRNRYSASELAAKLHSLARHTNDLPSDTCKLLESLFFEPDYQVLQDGLWPNDLFTGSNWALLEGAISFVLNGAVSLSAVKAAYPLFRYSKKIDNPCLKRLTSIWAHVHLHGIRSNPQLVVEFTQWAMERIDADDAQPDSLASALLVFNGHLEDRVVPSAFEYFAKRPYGDPYYFCPELIRWFRSDSWVEQNKKTVLDAAQKAITILDTHELWDASSQQALFFPLTVWLLGDETSNASSRVFLRGIEAYISQKNKGDYDPFMEFNWLFASVAPSHIRQALQFGLQNCYGKTRSICSLFLSAMSGVNAALDVE